MVILYAEDDPEDIDVFREAVKSIDSSIACIIAKDGSEALNILDNAILLPDYIFLDINMPMVGGKECLTKIRSNPVYKETPVIIYTTSNRPKDMVELKELGANEYIIKPNSFTDIIYNLSNVLKR